MFLDLLHTMGCLSELPEQSQTFCELLHQTFPYVLDTKLLAHSAPEIAAQFNSTALGDVYTAVQKGS